MTPSPTPLTPKVKRYNVYWTADMGGRIYVPTWDKEEDEYGDWCLADDVEVLKRTLAALQRELQKSHLQEISTVGQLQEALEKLAEQQRLVEGLRKDAERLNRKLTMDILLPPATTIKKGCRISTVVSGLLSRSTEAEPPIEREDEPKCGTCGS